MTIEEKEELYLRAKSEYYKGTPIMSDVEFDHLEDELKFEGSSVVNIVDGDTTLGTRYPHMNPMLSLEKLQVLDEEDYPVKILQSFFDKQVFKERIECTPKLDGSAMSLKYENGVLVQALTRGGGDKKGGLDKLDKLKLLVPNKISIDGIVEIRGEIVIDVKIFEEKYSSLYKNERNFVAGIMNRDDDWENIVTDFEFVAYHLVENADSTPTHNNNTMNVLKELGFNAYHNPLVINVNSAEEFFTEAYPRFKKYRETISPYRLDGIVLKMSAEQRPKLGENSHHPKWALAIKFPPDERVTKINDIMWQLGPSGAMTPIAKLEPILLDGTKVKRASLHNLGRIEGLHAWPGAKVIVAKKGDIIPQIIKVIERSETPSEIPTACPVCNEKLKVLINDDVKLLSCTNDLCDGKLSKKLAQGIKILGIERIGQATVDELFKAGIKHVYDLFNPELFNKGHLIESGYFKEGRSLDIILNSVESISSIKIDKLINSLNFTDSGSTISREVGKFLSNVKYDFKGLNKSVITKLTTEGSVEYNMIMKFIELLKSSNITVDMFEEEFIPDNIMFYEMTGSPKPIFKTKDEFKDFAKNKGYKHSKLNSECKYLLTDNYSSTSSKMKKAKKIGVEIITYTDFQNKYSNA